MDLETSSAILPWFKQIGVPDVRRPTSGGTLAAYAMILNDFIIRAYSDVVSERDSLDVSYLVSTSATIDANEAAGLPTVLFSNDGQIGFYLDIGLVLCAGVPDSTLRWRTRLVDGDVVYITSPMDASVFDKSASNSRRATAEAMFRHVGVVAYPVKDERVRFGIPTTNSSTAANEITRMVERLYQLASWAQLPDSEDEASSKRDDVTLRMKLQDVRLAELSRRWDSVYVSSRRLKSLAISSKCIHVDTLTISRIGTGGWVALSAEEG